jgi:Protein of unknown function (DUF1861)
MGHSAETGPRPKPKTIDQLLLAMPAPELYIPKARILNFVTAEAQRGEEIDVYNITAPFSYDGERYIAGRTEKHDDEASSQTRFYKHNQEDDTWVQDETMPVLGLQDPFVTRLNDKWIVGGVKTHPRNDGSGQLNWETHIYATDDLHRIDSDTKPTLVGPSHMKDIRLLQLQNGKILIATRPHGEKGGLGKAGLVTVGDISEINAGMLQDAPIIEGLFADQHNEWGGINELYELDDGTIGALGHIARFDSRRHREYYAMTCRLDPENLCVQDEKIIASSDYWPGHRFKRPDLEKVHFPGGMIINGELAMIYGGVGDASPGEVQDYPSPFWPAVPTRSLYNP